jgi:hypothetical protein
MDKIVDLDFQVDGVGMLPIIMDRNYFGCIHTLG